MINEVLGIARSQAGETENTDIINTANEAEFFRTACYKLQAATSLVKSERVDYNFKVGTETLFGSLDNLNITGDLEKIEIGSPGILITQPLEVTKELAMVKVNLNAGNADPSNIAIDISADEQKTWLSDMGKTITANQYIIIDDINFENLIIKVTLPAITNVKIHDMYIERFYVDFDEGHKIHFADMITSAIYDKKGHQALRNDHPALANSYFKSAKDYKNGVLGENSEDAKGSGSGIITHKVDNQYVGAALGPTKSYNPFQDGDIVEVRTDGNHIRILRTN